MLQPKFLTIGFNPTIQHIIPTEQLKLNDVNRTRSGIMTIGGKAYNQARVLSQLGEDVRHLTHWGGMLDSWFRKTAQRDGVELSTVQSDSSARFAYTLVNEGNVTEIIEASDPINPTVVIALFNSILDLVPQNDVIILSGSLSPGYPDDFVENILEQCKKNRKLCAIDMVGENFEIALKQNVDVVKINMSEFSQSIWGEKVPRIEIERKLCELSKQHSTRIILTDGSNGALFVENDSVFSIKPTVSTSRIINPIGSGDAFMAGFMSVYARDRDVRFSIEKGNYCGLLNATNLWPGIIKA